jgi:hypothetical protein
LSQALLIAALALLELAWLAWFHWVPLPNAGKELARWKLWLLAVPGISDRSILGDALERLSRLEFLPQRLPILLAAGLILAGAIALGSLLLRALRLRNAFGPIERTALAFGLGAAGLGALTLIAGRLEALSTVSVRIGLGLLIGLEVVWRLWAPKPTPRPRTPWSWWSGMGLGLVIGPFLVTSLLAAMLPTIDFDALEYHLQGPKEYFLDGRIRFLPHNVYTSMPFGVEMLHLLGMLTIGDWWLGALVGQVLIWAHAPAAAALIAATARRWASPRAGWVAAVVYLTTPWIYRLAALPYVEGPLCFYHAALVWTAACAGSVDPSARVRLWLVNGWLAGGAFACKYPALLSAVMPLGALAVFASLRRRSASILMAYALGVVMLAGPWLLKNVVDHGNPVYPLAYRVFGGHPWSEAREAKWAAAHGRKSITSVEFIDSVIDVAGRSDWQSALFTAFVPLAWLRSGSRRYATILGMYVLYLFLSWWLLTHRLDRFWLPLMPGLAVLAGLGADWVRSRAWSFVLGVVLTLGAATGLMHSWTDLTALNDWTADLRLLRTSVPRMLNRPLAALDAFLPPNAKPLMIGQAAVFHVNHRLVFNTVFDDEIFETIAKDRTPDEVGRELARRSITHVYVDWQEIERHRKPGGYGFTDFVRPREFDRLVEAGVLSPPFPPDPEQSGRVLYEVRWSG